MADISVLPFHTLSDGEFNNFIHSFDCSKNDLNYLNNKTFNPFDFADGRYNSSNDVDSFLVQMRNLNALYSEYLFPDTVPSLSNSDDTLTLISFN